MPNQTESAAIHYGRRGKGLQKWVNDKTPGATAVTLSDATLYHDIAAGTQVMITALRACLHTPSKNCHFNLVRCSAVAGGGTPTDIMGHMHIYSSGNLAGTEHQIQRFDPPIRVKYEDGDNASISVRVNALDANTVISVNWDGWVESERNDE